MKKKEMKELKSRKVLKGEDIKKHKKKHNNKLTMKTF